MATAETMKPSVRAVIAYIAGCLVSHTSYTHIFDQFQDRLLSYTSTFTPGDLTVIDNADSSEVMGMVTGKEITLYHSGECLSIQIRLNGTQFTGQLKDSTSFNGEVSDRIVKLYDYDSGTHYHFCLIRDTL